MGLFSRVRPLPFLALRKGSVEKGQVFVRFTRNAGEVNRIAVLLIIGKVT